jgi:2-dehydro-3-deoxyphosphogluconate aldolase/(4S)-4-hydroxy-2-oxoglutarate aldolase
MFESMNTRIALSGLVPVVKTDDPVKAVKLAHALQKGGLSAVEFTFRTDKGAGGLERIASCIRAVRESCPEMLVGAGTVINQVLAQKAADAGAQFIMSPGFSNEIVDYCISESLPVYPGVNTAGEIETALLKGLAVLKFFPAEASGGIQTIKALSGPFPGVQFLPTGGINAENLSSYIRCPHVIAAGGSWMADADLIAQERWDEITERSRKALLAMLGFRFAHVGINFDGDAAASDGSRLLSLFGYEGAENPASWFCGDSFELMKKNGRGVHGHIGFFTWNIERALAYLKKSGFNPLPETAQWCGEPEKSPLKFIYLDKSIAGFDIHLKRVD